ncbi:MAG: Quinoprotein glucose dehydrogenase [Candidatus Roizmanbacteria bacterium GW2011_GWC2_37_13]|uniref:Quinoprotein glucose dehydrogenase n=1 Tax=Candidatus Roizmanbacteria bacterium GW2011_GWC2_37_13 TaxID=1618486 RepID=A0A0G0FZE3_9BACT|nr:MAG: Quinoprotein glucose dehydrogenase [Candidatus Roizmanbacteria bacterium GW2011_GWC1_37_12]KKQ24313.1 MAG: Quinoprotein glucose dehydrogenase [Candidatus Roizmanbacteria bacterium GW2011_GWC2_37_13]
MSRKSDLFEDYFCYDEIMISESAKKYIMAAFASLIIFIDLSYYLFLRRGYYDLYIINKVFAGTSLTVLATVLLIGSLGRLYNLFDPMLEYRKHLGIVSFILAFFHGVISLFFLPSRFNINYYFSNLITFILGLTGLLILGYLFFISFKRFTGNLDPRKWWSYQVWGSRVAGILVFFHLVLMKYPGWLKWYANGGSDELTRPFMPPASIIAAAFGFFVILVRIFELINQKLAKFLIPLLFTGLILFIGLSFYIGKSKNLITRTVNKNSPSPTMTEILLTSIIAENLDTPWSIIFLPDKQMLVTERKGTVRLEGKIIATLTQVKEIGEGGLLGSTLYPDFESNHYIYFYYTYEGDDNQTLNRVVRMTLKDDQLIEEKIIIDKIPGAPNHNGGRIKFGPDNALYITTGDAQNPSQAQDKNSLAGKILRMDKDEKISVYSFGHRNPQGLAWDDQGQLYATEHGRSGLQSGLDEFNKIIEGKNYGWPEIQGNEAKTGMETSLLNSGNDTWAPAGMAYFKGSFYFGGLRGQALYKVTLVDGKPELKEYFKNELGRIRDVVLGPDNMLYISTSNQDGRGNPKEGDDKIIKINPEKL